MKGYGREVREKLRPAVGSSGMARVITTSGQQKVIYRPGQNRHQAHGERNFEGCWVTESLLAS
jgi:hypothetical protein